MLVLTREAGESFLLGHDIKVTVVKVGRGRVRLGIDAPGDVDVRRSELLTQMSLPSGKATTPAPQTEASRDRVPEEASFA